MKKLFALVITIVFFNVAYSQTVAKYGLPKGNTFDRWSVGAVGGIIAMQSDLKAQGESVNSFKSQYINPCYGGHVGYQLTHSIGFTLQGLWGSFDQQPDSQAFSRQLDTLVYYKLKSPFSEYSFLMNFSFGNISFIKRNSNLHFVVRAGAGLLYNKPDLEYSYDKSTYQPVNAPAQVSNVVIPVGVGVRYAFGKFNVGIDYDYRKAFTDKLDGAYVVNSNYDGYSTITAQVNYVIGKKKKAMEWVNPMEVVYNDISDIKDKVDKLTNDKDGDGVSDTFDKDNTTPAGQKVYGDGTSIDTDGDGIIDSKDGDPYSVAGAIVDANGVEKDTDNDGVADSRDKENDTPAGTLVNFQGISIDRKGESSAKTEISNSMLTAGYFQSVFFDLDKSEIKSIYYDRILTVARALKANPDIKLKIVGCADKFGNDSINIKLGLKRAEATKQHLVTIYGIDPARITTETKGKTDPLAASTSATNYLNRRVDFIIE